MMYILTDKDVSLICDLLYRDLSYRKSMMKSSLDIEKPYSLCEFSNEMAVMTLENNLLKKFGCFDVSFPSKYEEYRKCYHLNS